MENMKKSVSIPDELAFKAMDEIYIRNAKAPEKPTSFSELVQEALRNFLDKGVTVCKR